MDKIIILLVACMLSGCTTTYQNALCERPEYYAKWADKCREYSDTNSDSDFWSAAMGAALGSAVGGQLNSNMERNVTKNPYGAYR